MNVQELEEIISDAFRGVELEDGIGLWEAQAIDDYETEEIQKKKRDTDRTHDWTLFEANELARCESSLSFFDAKGMLFHLPAFILNELKQCHDSGVVFHLTQLDAYAMGKLTLLTPHQREAIRLFLGWCLTNFEYKFDWPIIEKVLSGYWQGDQAPPIIEVQ